jgi:hypothetical protein
MSHVRNFFDSYRGTKAYWHGPDNSTTGSDSPNIDAGIMKWLEKQVCANPSDPIDFVGHSRGGYIGLFAEISG